MVVTKTTDNNKNSALSGSHSLAVIIIVCIVKMFHDHRHVIRSCPPRISLVEKRLRFSFCLILKDALISLMVITASNCVFYMFHCRSNRLVLLLYLFRHASDWVTLITTGTMCNLYALSLSPALVLALFLLHIYSSIVFQDILDMGG